MLSQNLRTTILELHHKGIPKRQISKTLGVSRAVLKKVIRSQSAQVPTLHRPQKAEPHRQQILELYAACEGNLVRVHEELLGPGSTGLLPCPHGLLPP